MGLPLSAGPDDGLAYIVQKSGAWFAYNGEKIGQGRENAKAYLAEHPDVMEEITRKVRDYYHIGNPDGAAASEDESPESDGQTPDVPESEPGD